MNATPQDTNATDTMFTLDDFGSTSTPTPVSTAGKPAKLLSDAEQEIYDSLSTQERNQLTTVINSMDLSKPNFTSDYGRDARTGIAAVNQEALNVTRTKDLGDAGKSMTQLITQLKGITLEPQSQQRGLFRRAKSAITELNARYTSAESNVQKAVAVMEKHQEQLSKDNVIFDNLYNKNLAHYKLLTMYIIAGKMKLEQERNGKLAELYRKATETGDMADAEAYHSYEAQLDQFDSLISEFESSRMLCLQTAPAIRMSQENNRLLIQKFDYIFTTAVPSWRTQIQLAINMENSRQAANAASIAIDFTNTMIRQNADTLKQSTISTARLAQREIIESDTLEYANQRLIEGIQEVFKIHEEGKAQRDANRERKSMLEEDLKNELLQLTSKCTQL